MPRIGLGISIVSQKRLGNGMEYDPSALAFLTQTGIPNTGAVLFGGTPQAITGENLWLAVNQLTLDIKFHNGWNTSKGIYPMVGGTSFTHKWNLKDARDLDIAYRLLFGGSIVHSETGAKPNGTNAKANTFIQARTDLGLNDTFLGFYSRTNIANFGMDMGARLDTEAVPQIRFYAQLSSNGRFDTMINSNAVNDKDVTNSLGWFFTKRSSSTTSELFQNAVKIADRGAVSTIQPNNVVNLFCQSYEAGGADTAHSVRESAGNQIGSGIMSDANAIGVAQAWITFNTTLNRNV
jgi:hypothetical protein